jgi:hypothetical protein
MPAVLEFCGDEFCLFWAICRWIVAMHSFYAGGIWH